MRLPALALSLAASLAAASPAGAVLKHYRVTWTAISEFNTANPALNKYPPDKGGPPSKSQGLVDDANDGLPVLKKLTLVIETKQTVHLPGLSGFIFLSSLFEQGPRKALAFTGTGDTDTTIAWGLVTGWSITGGYWCHSSPSFICTYAGGSNLATVDLSINSPAYDLGTWTFHGTGFTSVPYINQVSSSAAMSTGNSQYQLRGRLMSAIIPALPMLGVALLGASLLLAGAQLTRGRSG